MEIVILQNMRKNNNVILVALQSEWKREFQNSNKYDLYKCKRFLLKKINENISLTTQTIKVVIQSVTIALQLSYK